LIRYKFISIVKYIGYDWISKPIYYINKSSNLMIDKTKIIDSVCERLEKLPFGHYIDLKTYKRNRTVIIVKIDEKKLLVIEDGYFKDKFLIKSDKLKKLLKTLLKKEFPRSKKIRLYVMGEFVDEETLNKKRKII
jgi:hypothetical protein